jgi:3-dehydroquinate synthase II
MKAPRVFVQPVAGPVEVRDAILERARLLGFTNFVGEGVPRRPGERWQVLSGSGFAPADGGFSPSVPLYDVGGPEDLAKVRVRLAAGERVAVRWDGERILPLETLVAGRGEGSLLWTVARRPQEAPGALGALEHGADAVVVEIRSPREVDELVGLLEPTSIPKLQWSRVAIRRVVPGGPGDRVLVDTTSLLTPEEGLLVGSVAGFLFLVTSEAVGSRYTRPRPFRVNAGAAHSYVLLASGETRYLSELEPGDAVLAVRPGQEPRSVRVGRIKTERRPLLLVEAMVDGRPCTIFVQEAETVRLSTPKGPVASTELRDGDLVDGVVLPPGRHLGVPIEERVMER